MFQQGSIVVPDPAPHRTLLILKLWRGSFPSLLNTWEIYELTVSDSSISTLKVFVWSVLIVTIMAASFF